MRECLENLIRKMLSHELQEVREIGGEVKAAAQLEVPNSGQVRRRGPVHCRNPAGILRSLEDRWQSMGDHLRSRASWWNTMTSGEDRIMAAALYRHSGVSFPQALKYVQDLDRPEQQDLARALLGHLSEHDVPVRELEYSNYVFDIVMDQGAYAEFKRHRMMTQTPQLLATRLGYSTPSLVVDAGMQGPYDARNARSLRLL